MAKLWNSLNQNKSESLTTHLFFILIDYTGLIIGLIKKTQQHEYAYKHGSQLSQTTLWVHNFINMKQAQLC
jgi:hypothetical protein